MNILQTSTSLNVSTRYQSHQEPAIVNSGALEFGVRNNCHTGGDASLQNGLELCQEMMGGVPPYAHKEVICLMAALSIVDPGRVEDSIQACKAAHIR